MTPIFEPQKTLNNKILICLRKTHSFGKPLNAKVTRNSNEKCKQKPNKNKNWNCVNYRIFAKQKVQYCDEDDSVIVVGNEKINILWIVIVRE